MMLKPLLACLALSAPTVAATAQVPEPGEWTVSGGADGCIAHATSPQGTVVSVLAGPREPNLIFLIQNRSWSSLRDGGTYQLAVALDGRNAWTFEAVAKTNLDSDGPGLLFTVAPGATFVSEFAAAAGLQVDQDGQRLDSLVLKDGASAMTSLAQCMAGMWRNPTGEAAAPAFKVSNTAVRL